MKTTITKYLQIKVMALIVLFLFSTVTSNFAQRRIGGGGGLRQKPATRQTPSRAQKPAINRTPPNRSGGLNNAGNRTPNNNNPARNNNNTNNNIHNNNSRNNVHNGNTNVNINVNNSTHVNNNARVNNGYRGNTVVVRNTRPYARPPYTYGGHRYYAYHPYYYHPYHPFFWGPAYHPWGFFIATLATTAIIVSVANAQYHYDQGVFYAPSNGGYTVVQAPVGAVVTTLPTGSQTVVVNETTNNYYYGGTYYEKDPKGYKVVPPTAGTIIDKMPDGGKEVKMGDVTYVKVGDTYYQPIQKDGKDVYEVVNVEADTKS